MAVERSKSTVDGRHQEAVATKVLDYEKDPSVKSRFLEIMWEWLEAPENLTETERRNPKIVEATRSKAEKAATVLGRAYVVEKREEIKPVPLPLGGEIDASGWEEEERADENVEPEE